MQDDERGSPTHIDIAIAVKWNYFHEPMAILKLLVYGYF
jgi:hypothetical protein